jgi:general secretion pathway protein D
MIAHATHRCNITRSSTEQILRKSGSLLVGFLLAGLLVGCAGQMAYRDGKGLVEQGKVEEGLAKFQEALNQNPQDAQYRQAYLQTRERALASFVEQGDQLAANGANDAAKKSYQRALAIDPGYRKAIDGMANLDSDSRQSSLLKDADAAFNKKDYDVANQKVAAVLTANPNNARALALKRSIEEKSTTLPAEAALAKAYKKQISIEFKDVSLKQIFEVISRTSGLNFLFDKDVKTDQKTSIFLKNSSIESAVHFVLLTNQLEQQVLDGNTVLIYPNTAAKLKDYQEMVVRTFFLTNAEAKSVANTLKTIVKSHDIVVDDKLNMIIVRDSPEAIKIAEKLVALQDVADPEVMLEVEVLEVQRNRLQDLGIQWPASLTVTPMPLGSLVSNNTGTTGTTGTTTTTPSSSSSTLSLHDLLGQNRNSLGVTVGSATINANLQDSDAKLLTNPRIRVRNHEKAKILIGERVPNITSTATSTGFVSQSINYIDIGLTLNVEPTIYLDDDVGIKVSLEVSSIISQVTTQSGTSAYEIGTRTATTSLRLKNGETDVLAGLIDNQERTSGNKLPGLGEMPVLGRLFGATTDDSQKTEIVLSITPHLIRNIQRPEARDANFAAGTETSMRNRPDSGGASSVGNTPVTMPTTTTPTVPTTTPNGLNAANPNGANPFAPNSSGSSGSSLFGQNDGSNGLSGASGNLNNGLSNSTPIASPVGDIGVGGAAGVAGAGSVEMQWQGPTQVAVGGTVAVALTMQATQPVNSVPMTLGFDNTKLQVIGVTEGTFLKQGGAQTSFSSRVNSSTGQVVLSDTAANNAGASASGIFATVTFKALAATSATDIQVSNVTPLGIGGVAISAVPPAPLSLQVTPQ